VQRPHFAVDQDDRASRRLVRRVIARGGVASAFAGEARTLGEGDLATDVDGLGCVFLAGAAMVSADNNWLGRRVPITKFYRTHRAAELSRTRAA
jgi:hypothetical protein